jgi:hypothetical protein
MWRKEQVVQHIGVKSSERADKGDNTRHYHQSTNKYSFK